MAVIEYADDDKTTLNHLIKIRIPSLLIGLFLGIILSIATSGFERVLLKNIQIAYFIPFIVYMASAVGSQTEAIYSRDLKSGHANFHKYLIKESALGIILGIISSLITAIIIYFWFFNIKIMLAVCLSMFITIAIAPVNGLLVTRFLYKEHTDPAAGAGPIGTIIQDTITVVIYGLISSWIIL